MMNIMVPLQIGARDVAFPFLNSVSFWLFTAGVALHDRVFDDRQFFRSGLGGLSSSFRNPNTTPVSESITGFGACRSQGSGTLLTGINFLVTIFKMRCPGMTLDENADVYLGCS